MSVKSNDLIADILGIEAISPIGVEGGVTPKKIVVSFNKIVCRNCGYEWSECYVMLESKTNRANFAEVSFERYKHLIHDVSTFPMHIEDPLTVTVSYCAKCVVNYLRAQHAPRTTESAIQDGGDTSAHPGNHGGGD